VPADDTWSRQPPQLIEPAKPRPRMTGSSGLRGADARRLDLIPILNFAEYPFADARDGGTRCEDERLRETGPRALVCADVGCPGRMRKIAAWESRACARMHGRCRKSRGPGLLDSSAT
jgi:hypothetical protein